MSSEQPQNAFLDLMRELREAEGDGDHHEEIDDASALLRELALEPFDVEAFLLRQLES